MPVTGGSAGEILDILRHGEPRTKSELATLTGQARSTITQRIDLLASQGLVGQRQHRASTGGRPSAAYAFLHDSRLVLTADLGTRSATYGVTDMSGAILAEHSEEMSIGDGPDIVLAQVVQQFHELLSRVEQRPVLGIGIGLPGPVEHSTGQPMSPPIMPGWDRYDVADHLTDVFGAPTLVDNDANLLAIGELREWPGVDDMVYVKVSSGIGAGLIVDGHVVRGAEGAAGDIGHVYTLSADGRRCRCGNTGCLEALAGGLSIAQQLQAEGFEASDVTDVAHMARMGNLPAIRALRESGRAIGAVLAALVATLNPRVIVLGGELAGVGEPLMAGVRETVYTRTLPLASRSLQVATSRTGANGGICGAAHMVLDTLLAPERLDQALMEPPHS